MRNEKLTVTDSMTPRAVAALREWLIRMTRSGLRHAVKPTMQNRHQALSNPQDLLAQSLHRILEVVPAVALVLDKSHVVVWANGRATQILGYTLDEMSGMRIESILVPSPRDNRPISFAAERVLQGLPQSTTWSAVTRTKSGRELQAQVTMSASLAIEPEPRVVVVIEPQVVDATDVLAPGDLEGIPLHASTSDLGNLAAALGHEVDQPLTAILSNAQAAQRFLAQTPPAIGDLRELLADVVADSERAHAIVRKMRRSAKGEPTATSLVDLGCLVRDVIRLLRRETQARGATVCAGVAEGLPRSRGDVVQLQQVLVNLLLNALDAVRDCRVEHRRIDVTVCASDDRGKVCIAVIDQGPRVDADRFETLFMPFVTSKPRGLGLGLTISRTIVMAHGGRLWVERNAGRGLTFHVELPTQPGC
ncbi:ATP-binding protein [Paraburkholderia youngii]|uniref:ATP-binding protein n=1 Tax=Paraburkholderia youngii TaxID=2782701 RepID=UPI001596341B|nr:ATP-binding protein [Paraburkholderia youngii]